ncbi:MAG: ParB/RepB/Spo0J family partition protein [Bacilli bacterium]|jgi:ParB family chromosome partitioning protein
MNIGKEVVELRLEDIIPNRFQPREKFSEAELNELAESIKLYGVINPIVVRKVGDKYEMVAGERRHKASMLAGKTTIPAIIAELNDLEAAQVALIENIQRQDLTAIEEARTYQTILRMGNITQEELAQKVGKTQPTIANKLRLLDLAQEVQDALLEGKISERHARALLNIDDREQQKALLDEIIDKRLTVRDLDQRIKQAIGKTPTPTEEPIELISEAEVDGQTPPAVTPPVTDIETIKQQATDIHVPEADANIGDLLKPEAPTEVKLDPIMTSDIPTDTTNRFIPPLEEANRVEIPTFVPPTPEITNEIPNTQPVDIPQTPTQPEQIHQFPTDTFVAGDLRTAINTIRQCISTIEKYGFKVDSEEVDFEKLYQVTIKIEK